MDTASSTTRYRVVIPNASCSRALLLPAGGGWGLPEWISHDPSPWEDVVRLNARLADTLNLRAATVRALALDWAEIPRTSYYLMDNLDPA